MDIIEYIPRGRKHAVTREWLGNVTGYNDRDVRRAIAEARKKYPIINLSDGEGYYLALKSDEQDVRRYLKQELNRIKSIKEGLTGIEKYIKGLKKCGAH